MSHSRLGPPQCTTCRHFVMWAETQDWTSRCRVFEDGTIPEEIWSNQHDHREAYPGDEGGRWEPAREGEQHPLDVMGPLLNQD